MSKVILVRLEVAHEHEEEAEAIVSSLRFLAATWSDQLNHASAEVVNEDPA